MCISIGMESRSILLHWLCHLNDEIHKIYLSKVFLFCWHEVHSLILHRKYLIDVTRLLLYDMSYLVICLFVFVYLEIQKVYCMIDGQLLSSAGMMYVWLFLLGSYDTEFFKHHDLNSKTHNCSCFPSDRMSLGAISFFGELMLLWY